MSEGGHGAVLVVGAGPTGLSAALALAQEKVPVRIIDQLAQPTNQSRAAIVHARTLEQFLRLGISEDFLAAGVKVHGAAIYGPGHQLLVRPTLSQLPTPFPFMIGLEQFETERILAGRLAGLGVAVEREVAFAGLTDTGAGVVVRLRHADGREEAGEFAYVLGADGARSAVRKSLGLELEGETLDTIWITADVRIRWDRDPGEAVACLSTEGIVFIAAMNDGRWRVIAGLNGMTRAQAENFTVQDIQGAVCERFGMEAEFYDPVWISPFGINTRLVSTMQAGRVFLAGDAAHVHSPVGGQGMNTGIQDALNLAWKLALVLRGSARPELLGSYHAERHANARRLLSRVGPATRMASLRHPVAIEIRNHLIHFLGELVLSHEMPRIVSMLDVAYPESPAVTEAHWGWWTRGPRAGDRAPDAGGLRVNESPRPARLFELWSGDPRHQLLVFGDPGLAEFPPSCLYVVTRIVRAGEPSAGVVVDADGQAHAAYGMDREGAFCLVRPDGVIAFRSGIADPAALSSYLAKWYGPDPAGTDEPGNRS